MQPSRLLAAVVFTLLAAPAAAAQGTPAQVTFESGQVVRGRIQLRDAEWIRNVGVRGLRTPSDALVFLADGSTTTVSVPLSSLNVISLSYDYPEECCLVRRRAVLELRDGRTVRGQLPSAPNGGLDQGDTFTSGVLVETSPLVIEEKELQSFTSSAFPKLSPDKRITRIVIDRPPPAPQPETAPATPARAKRKRP